MKKLKKKNSLDIWHVTVAAWSRTQIHMCDIVTSQTWKKHERKVVDDDHEDIEKKVSIFHILNGILAKTRNVIQRMVSLSYRGFLSSSESTTPSPGCTETQSQDHPWRAERLIRNYFENCRSHKGLTLIWLKPVKSPSFFFRGIY